MRIFIVFISLISTLSLVGNAGLGYYLYTFSLNNQKLIVEASSLKNDLATSNSTIQTIMSQMLELHRTLYIIIIAHFH